VKPLEYPLLADENIHPDVISYLRQQEHDIRSVVEDHLFGQSDRAVLRAATQPVALCTRRVVCPMSMRSGQGRQWLQ
jgi:hypothetical protein